VVKEIAGLEERLEGENELCLGRNWYEGGRFLGITRSIVNKKNSFKHFEREKKDSRGSGMKAEWENFSI